jgi:hypothetical protein
MLARDFYINTDSKGHDSKFQKGKSLYDDYLHSFIIKYCFDRYLKKDVNILELGTYSGRITKKLEKYSENITVSDVNTKNIYGHNKYDSHVIDLSKKFKVDSKFDLVCSIGHQVSFSNNIDMALLNISNLLNENISAVAIIDFWNLEYPNTKKPPYQIEVIDEFNVNKKLDKYNFEMLDIFYSGRLDTLFGRYGSYLINNFVKKNNVFSKLYIFIEGLFKKQNLLIKNVQTITIIAKKRKEIK